MKVQLLSEEAKMPKRADVGAAGLDLYIPRETVIVPGRNVVPLDIAMAILPGYEGHIRPRSGFSVKGMEGLCIADKEGNNLRRFDADVCQGTIDSTYRGNVGVIIVSHEKIPFKLPAYTRIAQMVISTCEMGDLEEVRELDDTERGDGGFGHSGSRN